MWPRPSPPASAPTSWCSWLDSDPRMEARRRNRRCRQLPLSEAERLLAAKGEKHAALRRRPRPAQRRAGRRRAASSAAPDRSDADGPLLRELYTATAAPDVLRDENTRRCARRPSRTSAASSPLIKPLGDAGVLVPRFARTAGTGNQLLRRDGARRPQSSPAAPCSPSAEQMAILLRRRAPRLPRSGRANALRCCAEESARKLGLTSCSP